MKKKSTLTPEELERRLAIINAREPEEPTSEDLAAIAAAEAEDPSESVTLEDYRRSLRR